MSNFWKSFLCVLACIFLCVASFFTGYFYRDTVIYNEQQSLSAVSPADASSTNYTYHSSNFPVLISIYKENSFTNSNVASSTQYLPFTFYFNTYIGEYYGGPEIDLGYDPFCILGFSFNLDNDSFNVIEYVTSDTVVYNRWTDIGSYLAYPYDDYFFGSYNINSNFNFNVDHVFITTTFNYGSKGAYATEITYYDSLNNTCIFQFVFNKNVPNIDKYYFAPRTYYFFNDFDNNDFYNQGYTTGYQNGVIAGEDTGYTNGYSNGYDDGLIDGYDNGVVSANDYSFSSLLTSVVSAPVTVFTDLLDFNIMGYSLLNIVMGLLTLGLVVLIIKLCLGGK